MATELNDIQGDLFKCDPKDALAHCVSQDLVMGKGIAKEFKERFDGVSNLKAQKKQVGEVASQRIRSIAAPEGRSIYYMITKERYSHKPTMEDFKTTLIALKDKAVEDQVTAISMPRIGCGLDRLNWNVVRQLIVETFHGTGIKINVYSTSELNF